MNKIILVAAISAAMLASGCASTVQEDGTDAAEVQRLKSEISRNEADNKALQRELAAMAKASSKAEASSKATAAHLDSGTMDNLPPNAKPGECYARVFRPAKYATGTREMLLVEASESVEVIPAEYGWGEKTVLVKEASVSYETVPAKFKWVEETVVVEPASSKLVTVPAKYDKVSEEVLVRAAYTSWKKGRGPIEKLNEATGEIMCLVEVPAEYKTVTKTVMVSPPTTREEIIPQKTKTVRKQVMVEPAKTIEIASPAKYDAVKVRTLVAPPQEKRTKIPAKYQTVTERKLVKDGELHWQEILCETNTTANLVSRLQRALNEAGFKAGTVDGILGKSTMSAISSYQKANGLASGQLTLETIRKLGIST